MSREKSHRNIGARIKSVRLAKNLTQKLFADSLGIAQGFLSEIEKGIKPPSDTLLIALSYLYEINKDWLLRGEGPRFRYYPPLEKLSFEKVPLLKKIPADFPGGLNMETLDYISFPGAPPEAYALMIKGDSMTPAIKDGDYALFILGTEIKAGDLIIVLDEWREYSLKRYREKEGKFYLTCDNPEYPPLELTVSHHIIGKVLNIWRKINF